MFEYVVDVLNEDSFSENNWTKLHEEDRFYNWYHGYTKLGAPSINDYDGRLYITIETCATSGVVTTQYYGEQFKSDLVAMNLKYRVEITPPEVSLQNFNLTLHFKVEKVSLAGLADKSEDKLKLNGYAPDNQIMTTNFTPPADYHGSYKYLQLRRKVTSEDLKQQKLDVMPGFRLTWWYSGEEVTPDDFHKYDPSNQQFIG